MPNVNEQVGKKIAEYRKLQGMTQREFANKLGKTVKSVQRYEYGITDLPLSLLFSIAKVLEPVHIKIASKIMAKEITARKTISSLS